MIRLEALVPGADPAHHPILHPGAAPEPAANLDTPPRPGRSPASKRCSSRSCPAVRAAAKPASRRGAEAAVLHRAPRPVPGRTGCYTCLITSAERIACRSREAPQVSACGSLLRRMDPHLTTTEDTRAPITNGCQGIRVPCTAARGVRPGCGWRKPWLGTVEAASPPHLAQRAGRVPSGDLA